MVALAAETYPLVANRTDRMVSYSSSSSDDDAPEEEQTYTVDLEDGVPNLTLSHRRRKERPIQPDHHAKEAIIYLGGIDHGKPARFVASRLAAKLNEAMFEERKEQHFPSNRLVYKTRDHFGYGKRVSTQEEQYTDDLFEFETVRHTISLVEEKAGTTRTTREEACAAADGENGNQVVQDVWPIVDVFELDYLESMSTAGKNQNLFFQTISMALAMVCYLISSTFAFFRILFKKIPCCYCLGGPGVLLRDVAQFSAVVFLFVMLVAYFATLMVAVGQTLLGLRAHGQEITTLQQITILVTFAGFIAPRAGQQAIVDSIVDYAAVVFYLIGLGPLRTRLPYQLDALMERIQERWSYDRIHLVSYSFGALLAIDALFPEEDTNEISGREHYNVVDHFVTFGCPFDMLRTFMPQYYATKRYYSSQSNNMRWTNMFVPGDALGSNFRNDNAIDRNPDVTVTEMERVPDKNIAIEPVVRDRTNVMDLIGFCCVNSVRLHVKHWDDRSGARDVSNDVVDVIFADHWVLAEKTEQQ